MKNLFRKYQKSLLKLANNRFGRRLLSIDTKEKIVGITDNAFAVEAENKLKAEFRCYPVYAKRIGLALSQLDIARDIYKGLTDYKGLLNYCGLLNSREFPTVMAASPATILSSAGDGTVGVVTGGSNWLAVRNATDGTHSDYTSTTVQMRCFLYTGTDYYLNRFFFAYNTSVLPSGFVCTAGVHTIVVDSVNGSPSDVHIVKTSQASATELATSDFNNLTFTAGTDADVAVPSAGNDLVHTLNSVGRGWINNTVTKLGVIDTDDFTANAPGAGDDATLSYLIRTSEYAGTANDPKLVVTYTPSAGFLVFM